MKRLFSSCLLSLSVLWGGCLLGAENADVHWLQPVDVYVPSEGGVFWDFTQSATCGAEIEAKVSFCGDSLVEIAMPTVRYLYTAKADTLRRILTETRFALLNDSLPLTAATPVRTEPATFPVAQTGMAFHHDFIVSEGTVTLLPDIVGTLVISPTDTIDGVVLRRTIERQLTAVTPRQTPLAAVADSLRFMRSRETYTWVRPGSPFPLAHTEIACDSTAAGRIPQVAETWILADPVEAPAAYAPRAGTTRRRPLDCISGDGQAAYAALLADAKASASRHLDGLLSRASITETASDVIVGLSADMLPDTDGDTSVSGLLSDGLTALLSDILGRVRSTGRVDGTAISLPRRQLPPGEYLLHLSTPAGSSSRKIVLH